MKIKNFCKNWKDELRSQIQPIIKAGKRRPALTIVQVGENPASNKYVDNKIKDCKEVGIIVELFRIPEDAGLKQKDLNKIVYDCESDGIIIQLPLPQGLDAQEALGYASILQDVDGFLPGSPYVPATALGIVTWLDSLRIDYAGKVALVIGRSKIVGKPVARELLKRDCTIVQAHSKTRKEDLDRYLREADIIVCAVGRAKFLDLEKPKDGVIVVDVGINFDESGKMVGDCWNHENAASGVLVTPVPGGVGLLTRCGLLENVVKAWKDQ